MDCINPFSKCIYNLNGNKFDEFGNLIKPRTCLNGDATLNYCPEDMTIKKVLKDKFKFSESLLDNTYNSIKEKLLDNFYIKINNAEESYKVREKFQKLGILWIDEMKALDYNPSLNNLVIIYNFYGNNTLTYALGYTNNIEADLRFVELDIQEFLETEYEV